jgi:hypothetical protein
MLHHFGPYYGNAFLLFLMCANILVKLVFNGHPHILWWNGAMSETIAFERSNIGNIHLNVANYCTFAYVRFFLFMLLSIIIIIS